jgi:hypothetical protein
MLASAAPDDASLPKLTESRPQTVSSMRQQEINCTPYVGLDNPTFSA